MKLITRNRLAAFTTACTLGLGLGMLTHTAPGPATAGASAVPTVIGTAACIEKIDEVIVECGRVVRTNAEMLMSTPLVAGKDAGVHGQPDVPQPTTTATAPTPVKMIIHEDPTPEGIRTVPTAVEEGTCQS